MTRTGPTHIRVRRAAVHNLRDIDVDVPLGALTALTGLSGSGKSSLAMGVLYAEGSARYLEALSTFTRRRLDQAARPQVERVDWCPPALALGQRPAVPGPRSTVGTMTSVMSVVRLMFSRLGTHLCPNGHPNPPSYRNAVSPEAHCVSCAIVFELPSAESFAYNAAGACQECDGLGVTRRIDESTIVPDDARTIAAGAVAPWRGTMRSNMPLVAAELGVRIDVPWRDLTDDERAIVLHGEETKRKIVIPTSNGRAVTLNAVYTNAVVSIEQLAREGTGTRAEKFLVTRTCPRCDGSRYGQRALSSTLDGATIAELSNLQLDELGARLDALPVRLPSDTGPVSERLLVEARRMLAPLGALGLAYLQPSRAGATLSTGERQRIALSRVAVSRSTGLLLVLDEPTVGLHPDEVAGLVELFRGMVADGNTLVVVDHDVQVLAAADRLIELGPGAGAEGGAIVAEGTPTEVAAAPASLIAEFLRTGAPIRVRTVADHEPVAVMSIRVADHLNLHDLRCTFDVGRLTVVAGASGSGKSALVLDSLVPALQAKLKRRPLPPHVSGFEAPGIRAVHAVDATPIGRNVRSTLVTYAGAFDPIRALFAGTALARDRGYTASHFSYNTKDGQCPTCTGTGQFALDLQYLPDLEMACPTCDGRRYALAVTDVRWRERSITDVLAMTAAEATAFFQEHPTIHATLSAICDVGLGYVTLGEATPSLSGGEAQRLRLAEPIRHRQDGAVFVFDEPSIGLHPRDVWTLLGVFDRLLSQGATIIAVDHDLDLIVNADEIRELGPGAGAEGGRLIGSGPPASVAYAPGSRIGPWLRPRG